MPRTRLRDLGITIGSLPTGPLNTITDVPGVLVGHNTLVADMPRVVRTGVTMIFPRPDVWTNHVFGGFFSFNGNGEMTGLPWLEESGLIGAPVGITNTHQVGLARDEIVAYATERGYYDSFLLPIVAETWDGWLSDIDAFPLTAAHARAAIESAAAGPVAEGNVGGGTGMICHGFKGGIGTSSRLAETASGTFTVGVLVQANYGGRRDLRLDGLPIGRLIGPDKVPLHSERPASSSSIIVIIATDAPLLPIQCKRLARRAASGLARIGGFGHNSSGDIFLAFATGNALPARPTQPYPLQMLPHEQIDPLLVASIEAVEESIWNALTAAETTTGFQGRTAYAIPLDLLKETWSRYKVDDGR